MLVTFFKNVFARTLEEKDLAESDLAALVRDTTARTKETLPWLKLARFGKKAKKSGSLRHDANVVSITGVELDYDDRRISFEKAVEKAREAGLEALLYTSPSHTPDKPKWRLLLPTSREMPPSSRQELARYADELYGGVFSPESYTLSQAYYYGRVGSNPNHQVEVIPGTPIDVLSNPYLRVAAEAPLGGIDVEQRLAAMKHHGEGDQGIHFTQLQCSASLLSQGVEEDEVVRTILEATKKVAPRGWDWEKEERAIQGMCRDWIAKRKEDASVVNLGEARAERQGKQAKADKGSAHIIIGAGIIAAARQRGEDLLITEGLLWQYSKGIWSALTPSAAKELIEREAEVGCRALKIKSSTRLINETRNWIFRNPDIHVKSVSWDAHGKVATKSGLVDWRTGEVEPVRPMDYCTHTVACEYDPEAKCPWWEKTLKDCFPKRDDEIRMLQEILGLALVDDKPRSLRRALVLVGPSYTGKSNLLETMAGAITRTANATPIEALEGAHGSMAFLKADPWVLHEAFDQSKWHFSASSKSILSGDPISINIKHGPVVSRHWKGPVFWGTNTPPQFKEATKAMMNRMIIVSCRNVFTGDPVGAEVPSRKKGYDKISDFLLATEGSGILNWALEGLRRAWDRGRFDLSAEAKQLLEDMHRESNIVAGFWWQCTEADARVGITMSDFCAAFSAWWAEERSGPVPSNESIGRALRNMEGVDFFKLRDHRCISSIKLNSIGQDYWQAASNSSALTGRIARISSSLSEVEKPNSTY